MTADAQRGHIERQPDAPCPVSIRWLDDSQSTPCVLQRGHDGQHQYEDSVTVPGSRFERCSAVHPTSGERCIEAAGHFCSHGDGSVIRWLTPDQRTIR